MKSTTSRKSTIVVPLDVYKSWNDQSALPIETKLSLLAIAWLPDRSREPSPIKLKLKLMSEEAQCVVLDMKNFVDTHLNENSETGLFLDASSTLNRFVKNQLTGDAHYVQA